MMTYFIYLHPEITVNTSRLCTRLLLTACPERPEGRHPLDPSALN
jgi:hypothetical protein